MINTQVTAIGTALLSVSVGLVSAIETGQHIVTSAMIEGTGEFSGIAEPGEIIGVTWALHKKTECPGWNARSWSGPDGFHLTEPKMPTTLPVTSEPKSYTIQTKVPDLAPEGLNRLTIVGSYHCDIGGEHPFTLGPVDIMVER